MATSDEGVVGVDAPKSVGAPTTASSLDRGRRIRGLIGQYALLIGLSLVVLGPLLLTTIQALSQPFAWAVSKPLHPVQVAWKDRTWFTGGAFSVVIRTLLVFGLFAWFQRVVAGIPWRQWRTLSAPAPLVSIVGTSVAFTVMLSFTFRSLYAVDGVSQWWIVGSMILVAALLLPGMLAARALGPVGTVLGAAGMAVLTVGAGVIFVGAEAWTATWDSARLGPAMNQSLKMAVLITVFQVVTSVTSAYAFVFLDFPFKRLIFALFMITLLLPLEVTLVGNVALIRQLEWINSTQGLVLPFAATALGTFLVRQGFKGVPPEINDACRLDGYGHLAFLTKFAVPLTRPVIAAFTVISALGAWNQYLWPRAIIDNDKYSTLQIQLRTIVGENVADANLSIAAALVAALPVLVLLVAFQRQIIRGLTAGAVK